MQIISSDPVKSPATVRRFAFALLWLAGDLADDMDIVPPSSPAGDRGEACGIRLHWLRRFLLLALTGGRVRWLASVLRLPLAFAFLDAVADRFGLLGAFWFTRAAWGDFRHFIGYTAQINPFLPSAVVPAVAVLATICEISSVLVCCLEQEFSSSRWDPRALLFLFGTAMTISGFSQFAYGVYLMAAGALALSTVDASLLSVDSLLRWRNKRP